MPGFWGAAGAAAGALALFLGLSTSFSFSTSSDALFLPRPDVSVTFGSGLFLAAAVVVAARLRVAGAGGAVLAARVGTGAGAGMGGATSFLETAVFAARVAFVAGLVTFGGATEASRRSWRVMLRLEAGIRFTRRSRRERRDAHWASHMALSFSLRAFTDTVNASTSDEREGTNTLVRGWRGWRLLPLR